MSIISQSYPAKVDITNCDKEPIHVIGQSQAHGAIIACNRKLDITRCSENVIELLGYEVTDLLHNSLNLLLPENYTAKIGQLQKDEKIVLPQISFQDKPYLIIVHLSEKEYILDIEPVGENVDPVFFQEQLTRILNELSSTDSVQQLSDKSAVLVKKIFNYDRVMLYRFDEEWNGEVIAEEREEALESWLGLHYPATDIPKPSRDLFLKQGVRIISDVHYSPSPLVPQFAGENASLLDLSKSELRGVSPIHIQYLKNMKVGASLTAAIVLNGELWGLLACHHYSPKFINYYQRQSIKFLSQIFSNSLALKNTNIFLEKTGTSAQIRKNLLVKVEGSGKIEEALTGKNPGMLDIVECSGGAIFRNGELWLVGITPSEEEVTNLIHNFLSNHKEKLFHSKNLCKVYSEAEKFKKQASGLLSVRLGDQNNDFLLWFRPESIDTVDWGGNPEKNAVVKDGINYLNPRKSFEKWTQAVAGISLPWEKYDFEAVSTLEEALTHAIVRQQKEEISALNGRLSQLNKELEMFSYSVSHDLRAPLRGIEGYAQILEEEYMEKLDGYGQKVVRTISSSAEEMELLIEGLLSLAKLGRSPLKKQELSIANLSKEVLTFINAGVQYPHSEVRIEKDLPPAMGDRQLILQLLRNLIDNALKYSSKVTIPKVEIGHETEGDETVYYVKDNGIGMDARHKEKIFNVFSRLVKKEYPGSGIGLAIAQKVVDRHDGRIWIETAEGKGSTFYFTLGVNSEG